MIRSAITCDREGCMAFLLEPLDDSSEPSFAEYAYAWGWKQSPKGHTCPPCVSGRGLVLERGECPVCGGSLFSHTQGDKCRYCEHVLPYFDEDDEDEFEWMS